MAISSSNSRVAPSMVRPSVDNSLSYESSSGRVPGSGMGRLSWLRARRWLGAHQLRQFRQPAKVRKQLYAPGRISVSANITHEGSGIECGQHALAGLLIGLDSIEQPQALRGREGFNESSIGRVHYPVVGIILQRRLRDAPEVAEGGHGETTFASAASSRNGRAFIENWLAYCPPLAGRLGGHEVTARSLFGSTAGGSCGIAPASDHPKANAVQP